MNIVFLDEYSLGGIDLSRIKQLGNYTGYEKTTPGEIAERCIDADIVITNKVPLRAEAIKVLPQLKLICIAATGMNNVDLEAAAERGIEVRNAVGYSTHAVTETTIGAAIALLRQSKVLESCVPVTRLTLAIRNGYALYFVQLRIAKVNLVTGTQDSSTLLCRSRAMAAPIVVSVTAWVE